jgi:2-C-methyl-D-erythritol 4-phosphate cytidylyltransferase
MSARVIAPAPQPSLWAVVPAAGQGLRMGQKKQALLLAGQPVLRWTIEALEATPSVSAVVVTVPAEDVADWQRRLAGCPKVGTVLAGGAERQESVRLGLAVVPDEVEWILVHDGVRPCVTPELVARVVDQATQHGAAIAALPVSETIKRGVGGWVKETVEREGLWAVQTPQVFRAAVLREAHRRAAAEGVTGTDDAMLVERLGVPIRLVPGRPENLKITRPDDLPLAEALLARKGSR